MPATAVASQNLNAAPRSLISRSLLRRSLAKKWVRAYTSVPHS
jgi:hypothetical protein